ncbi:hypothetical protein HQ535_09225 [bacterium]|nr:hypothetical protein [bacterium]
MKATADAPASSANLGPGFDVLGLAFEIRCRVTVEPAAEWTIISAGAPAPRGGVERVTAMAAQIAPDAGPFHVEIDSDVPIGVGLGSSACLVVAAGAAFAASLGMPEDLPGLLKAGAAVEGHADNVAAAVHGGLVAVAPTGAVLQASISEHLIGLLAVPSDPLPTEAARGALSLEIDLPVVGRTVGRALFLMEGLRTGNPGLLAEAAGDEVHEERRDVLSPLTGRLVGAARQAGALHSARSGAGPSALAFVDVAGAARVRAAWNAILDEVGGSVLQPEIATVGVRVLR